MQVAIIGAGQMGIAIAATFLKNQIAVLLYDVAENIVLQATGRVAAELEMQHVDNTAATMCKLSLTQQLSDTDAADIFIETIIEKKRLKQQLYQKLSPFIKKDALLLTNTSTISINALAEGLLQIGETPLIERFCGFHFFHPVRARSVVEIIRSERTSPTTIERAVMLAHTIEKKALLVNDGPGFLVNRLLNSYLTTALQLLTRVNIEQIDTAAEAFGMAMGPFRIMDEIGLDVTLHAGWVLHQAFPDRVPSSPVLLELVRRGQLGRKTGCGFMCYDSKTLWHDPGHKNHELESLLQPFYPTVPHTPMTNEAIVLRLTDAMHFEAERLLDDGITSSLHDIEAAARLALGFPQGKWR